MAYILYLETATKNCSVAIGKGNELLCLCEEQDEGYSHAEKLHTFIKWALEGAELTTDKLDAVCVSKGPGSYTGLRIGVSAAKGLCFALNIPLLAVNSLDILAHAAMCKGDFEQIIPMLDARRNEVYTKQVYSQAGSETPTQAVILGSNSFGDQRHLNTAIVGNGSEKAKVLLEWENATFLTDIKSSAKDMLTLGEAQYSKADFEDVAYFEPYYLKEFISSK